jgi:hypothetical protein
MGLTQSKIRPPSPPSNCVPTNPVLPDEVWQNISGMLDYQSNLRLGQVCSGLREVVRQKVPVPMTLLQQMCQNYTQINYLTVSSSGRIVYANNAGIFVVEDNYRSRLLNHFQADFLKPFSGDRIICGDHNKSIILNLAGKILEGNCQSVKYNSDFKFLPIFGEKICRIHLDEQHGAGLGFFIYDPLITIKDFSLVDQCMLIVEFPKDLDHIFNATTLGEHIVCCGSGVIMIVNLKGKKIWCFKSKDFSEIHGSFIKVLALKSGNIVFLTDKRKIGIWNPTKNDIKILKNLAVEGIDPHYNMGITLTVLSNDLIVYGCPENKELTVLNHTEGKKQILSLSFTPDFLVALPAGGFIAADRKGNVAVFR